MVSQGPAKSSLNPREINHDEWSEKEEERPHYRQVIERVEHAAFSMTELPNMLMVCVRTTPMTILFQSTETVLGFSGAGWAAANEAIRSAEVPAKPNFGFMSAVTRSAAKTGHFAPPHDTQISY